MTDTLNESQAVADLAKKGCLVWLRVKRPSLSRQLSAESLGLPPSITGLATTPKVLPPGSKYKDFAKVEARARNAIETRALSGGDARFVPYSLIDGLQKEVTLARDEYMGCVELFLRDYEKDCARGLDLWIVEARKIWDKLDPSLRPSVHEFESKVTRAVRDAWPKIEDIQDRFSMRLRVLQFALPGISTTIAHDAEIVADAARKLASESLTGFYADIVGELRSRTVEMADQIVKSLDGPRFGENSLKSLRGFLRKFEALNIADDHEIAERVQDLQNMLGSRTSEDIRGDQAFRASFRASVETLRNEGTKLLTDAEKDAQGLLQKRYGAGIRKVA